MLIVAMFADITDDVEMKTGERLEATAYSFKGLVYKISGAVINVVLLQIINVLGYNARRMERITDNVTEPLINSTTTPSFIEGINYTTLLNGIFFMLTAAGAIILLLQAIPMFFLKFDEDDMERRLEVYRKKKQDELQREIDEALIASGANA